MKPCIFCEIIAGRVSANFVYKDSHFSAFLDIFPMRPGHILVTSVKYAERLEDLEETARESLMQICNKIINAQRASGFGVAGTNILVNDGKGANQHLPHFHVHLVPRTGGDLLSVGFGYVARGLNFFGREKRSKVLKEIAEKIKCNLKD